MPTRVVVFVNYDVRTVDGAPVLEVSHPLLFDPLLAADAEVTVAAPVMEASGSSDASAIQADSPAVRHGVGFRRVGTVQRGQGWLRRGLDYVARLVPIVRAVRAADVAYIFVPGHTPLLAVLACWMMGRPYALYLRGDEQANVPVLLRWLIPQMHRRARFLVVTGDELADTLAARGCLAVSEVPMSPLLWMDELHGRSGSDGGAGERTSAHVPTILYVGQMTADKGIFELVSAVARLRDELGRVVRLVLVGGGADADRCRAQVAVLQLGDVVEVAGQIDTPAALAARYADADLFAIPSGFPEGFPRVLWEAMAFSLPIVTSSVGQIATVLTDDDSALFCAPRSVDSLVVALRRLLDDRALAARIGARGHETWLAEKARCRILGSHGDQVVRELVAQGLLVAGRGAASAPRPAGG